MHVLRVMIQCLMILVDPSHELILLQTIRKVMLRVLLKAVHVHMRLLPRLIELNIIVGNTAIGILSRIQGESRPV